MHFYAWKKGLKTGMYYLRSRPAAFPDQTTVSVFEDPYRGEVTSEISSVDEICEVGDSVCVSCTA